MDNLTFIYWIKCQTDGWWTRLYFYFLWVQFCLSMNVFLENSNGVENIYAIICHPKPECYRQGG